MINDETSSRNIERDYINVRVVILALIIFSINQNFASEIFNFSGVVLISKLLIIKS